MKTPSLALFLAAAVAAPVLANDPPASGPVSAVPAPRCDVAWLTTASGIVSQGGIPSDPNKYLTSEALPAGGTRPMIDIVNAPKLCDPTVWHYLAVLTPVGEPILDPKTHQPIGGVTLAWNDPNLQKDWASGLGEQIKILLAVSNLYQGVDSMGADALAKADAVTAAAAKSGVVVRTDGAGPAGLQKDGYTIGVYGGANGYAVAAPAAPAVPATGGAAAAPAAPPADMKAAFSQLLADAPAKAAPANAAPPAPNAPAAPKPLKAGPALAAYRQSVIAFANELAVRSARRDLMQKAGVDATVTVDFAASPAAAASAKAVMVGPGGVSTIPADKASDADAYEAAVKFITDPAITDYADESTHDSAALSRLDYGLRNLIALRAAAVKTSVAEAKKLLAGRGVAETLAAMDRGPASTPLPANATMAAAVLAGLNANPDYQSLNSMYDAKSKADPNWSKTPEAQAIDAQRTQMAKDAAATTAGPNGILQYSVRGKPVTDANIRVADLAADPVYKTAVADMIAKTIVQNTLQAKAQAVIAAVTNAMVGPTLTPSQTMAAVKLPPASPPPAPVPPAAYQALLTATPAGLLGVGDKDHVARYYSKVNEAAAATASANATARAQIETQANQAADAVRQHHSPDDSDATVTANATAAYDKVISDAKAKGTYLPPPDNQAARAALDKTVDAAYSDGVAQSVDKLNADYKAPGNKRRKNMESESGYAADGGKWYNTGRVDAWFQTVWGGDKRPPAVSACKTALGFKMGGDASTFKDPNEDNVDGSCGVHNGLKTYLRTFLGGDGKPKTTSAPPPPPPPAAPH